MMGMFTANAVKKNDSTWVDHNELGETNGTGTITFQGENVTLDIKGRNNPSEGRGIISQNVKLKKSS